MACATLVWDLEVPEVPDGGTRAKMTTKLRYLSRLGTKLKNSRCAYTQNMPFLLHTFRYTAGTP